MRQESLEVKVVNHMPAGQVWCGEREYAILNDIIKHYVQHLEALLKLQRQAMGQGGQTLSQIQAVLMEAGIEPTGGLV